MFSKRILQIFPCLCLILLMAACQVQLTLPDSIQVTDESVSSGDRSPVESTTPDNEMDEPSGAEGVPTANVITEDATSEDAAAEERAADSATPEIDIVEEPTAPAVTIIVPSLRVRSGPGTVYPILGTVSQGESYAISGQANGCGWYTISHPTLSGGWISGGTNFVQSNVECEGIVAASIPPAPVAPPAEQGESAPAPETTTQETSGALPTDQGCYLLQNQLGPELTFTFTGDDYSDSVKVRTNEDVPYCLYPGTYTVTVDAPPPWSELNETLKVVAGVHLFFPIRPR
ncbi:MAG: SH3 domain-containing protein [Chloroflexota bacterium]